MRSVATLLREDRVVHVTTLIVTVIFLAPYILVGAFLFFVCEGIDPWIGLKRFGRSSRMLARRLLGFVCWGRR